jgi:hypothetical protein
MNHRKRRSFFFFFFVGSAFRQNEHAVLVQWDLKLHSENRCRAKIKSCCCCCLVFGAAWQGLGQKFFGCSFPGKTMLGGKRTKRNETKFLECAMEDRPKGEK